MTFIGPYEILGELGRGAMARVWRAWDPNLEREVAIKEPLLDAGLSADVVADLSRRFVQEAKTVARFNHPGIVTVYAADVYDGRLVIVMELVDGSTLDDFMASSGSLTPNTAIDVLDQLLDAVGYAHSQGVVHRDIKPSNIFVNSAGRVKLADFGIAHVDDAFSGATVAGAVLGTPGYMSPEQARGAEVDGRSDLFSIGVVGYEMLSGVNPFGLGDGASQSTLLNRVLNEPVAALPPSVSVGQRTDVRPAIMAALSKEPDARPQSADEFKKMLRGQVPVRSAASTISTVRGQADFREPPDSETAELDSRPEGSSVSRWLPFALIGVGAIIVLLLVFSAASGVGGGGGGGTTAKAASSGASSGSASSRVASSSASAASAESPVDPAAIKGFVGRWELTKMVQDGQAVSEEDIALLKESGVEMSAGFANDGSATLTLIDAKYTGTWFPESKTYATLDVEDEVIDMYLYGTTLVLEGGEAELYFEKV